MNKTITTLLALLISISVFGQEFDYGDLTYEVISSSDRTCRTKAGSSGGAGNYGKTEQKIIVPETVEYGSNRYTVTEIGDYSFYCGASNQRFNSYISSIELPSSIRKIGDYAFYNNSYLEGQFVFNEGLEEIGWAAFENCKYISGELVFPESLRVIGENAFTGCERISGTLKIPEGVTKLPYEVFHSCGNIESVILPSTLSDIGDKAFGNCDKITSVFCYALTPPKLNVNAFQKTSGSNIDNVYLTAVLYVPEIVITSYREDSSWKKFANIQPLPVGIDEVSVTAEKTQILIGEQLQLSAEVVPENATEPVTVTWISKSPEIASVDHHSGLVTGLDFGVAEIEVTASNDFGSANASFSVEVYRKGVESVSADFSHECSSHQKETVKVGDKITFISNVLPLDGVYQEIRWITGPENVGSISSSGVFTALAPGKAEVTVTVVPSSETLSSEVSTRYEIEVVEGLPGDANDNGSINVADVVTIANTYLEIPSASLCKGNADADSNGDINVNDVVTTVNLILNDEPVYAKRIVDNNESKDYLRAFSSKDDNGNFILSFSLAEKSSYTALQVEIALEEGMKLIDVIAGSSLLSHTLTYNVTDSGVLKILVYSLSNLPLESGNTLFNILFEGKMDLELLSVGNIVGSNITATQFSLGYEYEGAGDMATVYKVGEDNVVIKGGEGFIEISGAQNEEISVYTLDAILVGRKILGVDTERLQISKGVYVIKCGNITRKIYVK